MSHKPDCLFCKIVAGEIPSYKVYEDEHFFGFLDIHPHTKGDSLLVPKEHYVWTYDVPYFGEYWEVVQKFTRTLLASLEADWVNYFTYGQIDHAHIHVMPRYGSINDPHNKDVVPRTIKLSENELAEIADKISSHKTPFVL